MSSPQNILKKSYGETEESPEVLKQKQQDAELEQKNIEAWARWKTDPQTQRLINILTATKAVLSTQIGAVAAQVPGVSNDYLRARLVEINVIDDLLTNTFNNGNFRAEILNSK